MKSITLLSISFECLGSSLKQAMPSVITPQASCVSTSAIATLKRLRTRCATDLTTMRLPLSELFSGRCSATRATPTCIAITAELSTFSLAESEAFDYLIERGAVLVELLGGRRAGDHVGRRTFDDGELKGARLVVLPGGVLLGKGEHAPHRRIASGTARHDLLACVTGHLLLHGDLEAGGVQLG